MLKPLLFEVSLPDQEMLTAGIMCVPAPGATMSIS
jgi:hypothetical protein